MLAPPVTGAMLATQATRAAGTTPATMPRRPGRPRRSGDLRARARGGARTALARLLLGLGRGTRRPRIGARRLRVGPGGLLTRGRRVGGRAVHLGRPVDGGTAAVRPVEAGTLEHDANRREQLAKPAPAGGAHGERVIAELLDSLEALPAFGARILVRRHLVLLRTPPLALTAEDC